MEGVYIPLTHDELVLLTQFHEASMQVERDMFVGIELDQALVVQGLLIRQYHTTKGQEHEMVGNNLAWLNAHIPEPTKAEETRAAQKAGEGPAPTPVPARAKRFGGHEERA